MELLFGLGTFLGLVIFGGFFHVLFVIRFDAISNLQLTKAPSDYNGSCSTKHISR